MAFERLTVSNYADTTDSMGGFRKGTSTDTEIWAEVLEKSYNKILENGQAVARRQYEVVIRKETADLVSLDQHSRITYRTRPLAIQSIKQNQIRSYVTLTCTENA